jgi:outer membrane scaffolding protein for murein synthesis (MipA/OmpV family)
LVVILGHQAVSAQERTATSMASARSVDKSQWGLGLAVGSTLRPYRGVDSETIGLPILIYESRWLSVAGPVVDLKLPSPSSVSFRLRARYEPGIGYQADDSSALSGMEDRKAGAWIGGAVLWHTGIVDLGGEWLGDASGYSKGQRATFSLQRQFPLADFLITPRFEAIWLDRKYVDYYYGVRAEEVLAGRAFYEADSTVNTRLGVRVDYRIRPRHSLFLDLSATRLGNEIEDSPLVDRSNSSAAFIGYTYLF